MNPTEIPQGAREAAQKEQQSNRFAAEGVKPEPTGHFVHAYAQQQVEEKTGEVENASDDLWLNSIAEQYNQMFKKPYSVLDGETREEGIDANICHLYQIIEDQQSELTILREVAKGLQADNETLRGTIANREVQLASNTIAYTNLQEVAKELAESLRDVQEHWSHYADAALTRYAGITGGK